MSKSTIAMTARVQESDGVRELSMEEVDAVVGGDQITCTFDKGSAKCSCPEGSSMTITKDADGGFSASCEPRTS